MSPSRRPSARVARVARVAALVLCVGLLASACGVPTDSEFQAVRAQDVPFDLGAAVSTTRPGGVTTTVPPPEQSPVETVTLYWVVGESVLIAVERELVKPASLGVVVSSLAVGPRFSEQEQGYRTVVSFGHIAGVQSRAGVATVDLSPTFLELAPSEQRLAVAQLVFTLTARPGIGQVAFDLEGTPVAVPLPDGSLASGAIARELFPSMLYTPATTTTALPPSAGPAFAP